MATEEFPARGDEPLTPARAVDREREQLLAAVGEADFPVVLRGYDRAAVDRYVDRMHRVVAELDDMRSADGAVRRALDRVGEETSAVLQRASEAAERITAESRARADDRLQDAERGAAVVRAEADREAAAVRAEADRRVAEAEAEIEALWAERERVLEDVEAIAGALGGVAAEARGRLRWGAEGETEEQPVYDHERPFEADAEGATDAGDGAPEPGLAAGDGEANGAPDGPAAAGEPHSEPDPHGAVEPPADGERHSPAEPGAHGGVEPPADGGR